MLVKIREDLYIRTEAVTMIKYSHRENTDGKKMLVAYIGGEYAYINEEEAAYLLEAIKDNDNASIHYMNTVSEGQKMAMKYLTELKQNEND